jgi:hypothetical protein
VNWDAARIIRIVLLTAVAVIVALMARRCYRQSRGIEVCLHNVDTRPLRSGEVTVTSSRSTRRYAVGELAPRATGCVWVKADDEASVDVTFTTTSGAPITSQLDGYIEQGYWGWISADVAADGAREIKQDLHYH